MTNVASQGPTAGSLIVTTQGYVGLAAGTSTTLPLAWGILNYTYLTDNHSLAVTLGDQGHYDQAGTYLYTHSDTAHTVGSYCKITNDLITIGSYTRSGSTYTYTPFSGGTVTVMLGPDQGPGSGIEFHNNGTNWFVLLNGTQVLTVANSSVTFSAARRTAAVSMERKFSATGLDPYPAGDFDSFRIAGITMSDFVVPTYKGSGAKMYRAAANSVSTGSGSGGSPAVLPTSTFDTSLQSADITTDLTHTKFTVTFAGWYKVALRLPAGNSWTAGQNGSVGTAIFQNGSIYEMADVTGQAIAVGDSFMSSHVMYLNAGDTVQAAYTTGALGVAFGFGPGDSNGQNMFFSIGLLTKSLIH